MGSPSVLSSAVFSGADCVYLSGRSYGARGFADNFSLEDIRDAVSFCHECNVEVYVTVNVSILESEFCDVLDYVYFLYCCGVDAVIVEDLGLAGVIKGLIPDLSIHASTQLTCHDYLFVKWLSDFGFSSVNLSREVSIGKLKDIRSRLDSVDSSIRLEVFGHGALCYSYSGRCLMSSFLGGRSGNRGLCAQPCRMIYTLEDELHNSISDSGYLLSTKDLCTIRSIRDVVEAGADTVKIEGRMKSWEYVASSVYCYKRAIVDDEFDLDGAMLMLNLAFNRGLTGGYLLDDNVMCRTQAGSLGYPIGRVVKCGKDTVTIKFTNKRFPVQLVNGDGLSFIFGDYTCGMYVSGIVSQTRNRVTIKSSKAKNVKKDSLVYITYSKYLENKCKDILNKKMINKIPLDVEVTINNDMQMQLKCIAGSDGKTVEYTSDEKFQKARKQPLTKETITKQLKKTGNTNYTIENITYHNFKEDLFMSISTLNNIRRQLLDIITRQIQKDKTPTKTKQKEAQERINKFKEEAYYTNKKTSTKWTVHITNPEQAKIIEDYDYIHTIYYDGSYNHKDIEDYLEKIADEIIEVNNNTTKEVVWQLPQLLEDKDLPHIAEILVKLKYNDVDIKVQTDNIAATQYLDTVCYSKNLNIYNNQTIKQLSQNPGYKRITISPELSLKDLAKLTNKYVPLEYQVFGNIQVMITKDNFNDITDKKELYLKDEQNNTYPVKIDCYNKSQIYDYRTLDLKEEIGKLEKTCIEYLSIDAKFYTTEQLRQTLDYINNPQKKKVNIGSRQYFKANLKRGLYVKQCQSS